MEQVIYKGIAIQLEYDKHNSELIYVSFSNNYDCISFYKVARSKVIAEVKNYIDTGVLNMAHTVEVMYCGDKFYRVNQAR
jgi:catabolite regulation protein CreA